MSSGVRVHQDVVDKFQDLKLRHCYRYISFHLNPEMTEIQVEKCADKSASYDEFLNDMKRARDNGECRYAVYDAEYLTDNGQQRNKLVFILWSPEDAKLKQKMVYTSSKDAIKKKVDGIAKEIQATDNDEISWEHILEVCKSTDR
jgi:hypothetical protein